MAATKAKRRRAVVQDKNQLYVALYNLNSAFQQLAVEIQRLEDESAIPRQTLRLYRTTAEELRSAMNHRIVGILAATEETDWARYGTQLRNLQEGLKSSRLS